MPYVPFSYSWHRSVSKVLVQVPAHHQLWQPGVSQNHRRKCQSWAWSFLSLNDVISYYVYVGLSERCQKKLYFKYVGHRCVRGKHGIYHFVTYYFGNFCTSLHVSMQNGILSLNPSSNKQTNNFFLIKRGKNNFILWNSRMLRSAFWLELLKNSWRIPLANSLVFYNFSCWKYKIFI